MINKRPTGQKAHQSFGIELLPHLLSHFYRVIENIHLQAPNLIAYGVGNKICNYFPHFNCHGNQIRLTLIGFFFFLLHLVAMATDQNEQYADKKYRADRRPRMEYSWKSLVKLSTMAWQRIPSFVFSTSCHINHVL